MSQLFVATVLLFSALAQAAISNQVNVYCESANPKGAIFLSLNSSNNKSFGRMSTPFTTDLATLKQKNPKQDQYNQLNVGFVEKTNYGFKFNASPYQLVNHEEVNRLTKSHLYLDLVPAVLEMFEDRGNIFLTCEVL